MRFTPKTTFLLSILAAIGVSSEAFLTEPAHEINIIGNKFFNSTSGEQFFIKGVAYQRSRKINEVYDAETETAYVDSLAHPALCLKDLESLKELGINTVRVYQIDPTKNHDVCMNAFASHGIYVLADLSEPKTSINQECPAWDVDLYKRYTAVVDSLHSYSNMLGFIAGNEVLNDVKNSAAAPFVKASVRDIKAYIRQKNYRRIPVGYASADDTITRLDSARYFGCKDGGTESATVDFYALNMFEWCGYSSYGTSGYRDRTAEFSSSPVPVFFSEYGCNAVRPRPFTEIDSIYGPAMTDVWSGGIVYEFFQNENRFGLVDENSLGHVIRLEEFNIVKVRLVETVPKGVHRDALPAASMIDSSCPQISDSWNASAVLPPSPDSDLCACLDESLACVVTPYAKVNEHELLKHVCSKTDCREITADGSKGVYGRFSGCSTRQKASYALNKFYNDKKRRVDSCDFGKRAALASTFGNLGLRKPHMPGGRTCEEVLNPQKEKEGVLGETAKNGSKVAGSDDSASSDYFKSAAQRPAEWGSVLLAASMVSLMYLTT